MTNPKLIEEAATELRSIINDYVNIVSVRMTQRLADVLSKIEAPADAPVIPVGSPERPSGVKWPKWLTGGK